MLRFGPFALDEAELTREGEPVPVSRPGLALLAALARAEGPVSRDALIEAAWPGLVVEDANLTVQVGALRKALGQRSDGRDWIGTVPRFGYRLQRDRAPAADAAAGDVPAIAVLPFANLTGDAAEDYFVDGVVEDIITALSRFRSFAVIARNSSFVYRGQSVDIRKVASELGAGYVLEGSMRKVGNRLRIAAQLIRGGDGAHVWARNFDGELGDVFDFEDRIAEGVVGMIEPQIQYAELERSRRERPGSMAAYDLYLRALPRHAVMTPDDNAEAIALLERAIAIAPAFAVALKVLVDALSCAMSFGWRTLGGADLARCTELTERALEAAGTDATVIAQCAATLVTVNHDYKRGMQLADRALAINPNNCDVVSCAAVCSLHCGSLETTIELCRRALRLSPGDPLNEPFMLSVIGHANLVLGNHEEAVAWAERAMAIRPTLDPPYWILIGAHVARGDLAEARRIYEAFHAMRPAVTIAHIRASQPTLHAERVEPLFAGLHAVGMPEG